MSVVFKPAQNFSSQSLHGFHELHIQQEILYIPNF